MKSRVTIALLVIAVLVLGAVMAVDAQRGRMPAAKPGPGAGAPGVGCPVGVGPWMARELNLTQDQIRELQQLRDEYLAATKATRDELQAKCKEMAALWAEPQPNVARIKQIAAEMDALRAQLRDAGIDKMISGLNVLNPDQRAKVRAAVKDMGARCMGAGCGMGLGPGCGPGMGCGMGPGMGAGMGPGAACGPGGACGPRGMGGGTGPGWGNATGPRSQMGTCPKLGQ